MSLGHIFRPSITLAGWRRRLAGAPTSIAARPRLRPGAQKLNNRLRQPVALSPLPVRHVPGLRVVISSFSQRPLMTTWRSRAGGQIKPWAGPFGRDSSTITISRPLGGTKELYQELAKLTAVASDELC